MSQSYIIFYCIIFHYTILYYIILQLISMSQYFSAKLEIVVRQATDGKKMIATAPEIYSPRVSCVPITCM